MHVTPPEAPPNDCASANTCLARLRILSLNLETYGAAADAATLREIIVDLEKIFPAAKYTPGLNFLVAEMFTVERSQVASLLCCALNGSYDHWFRIVKVIQPPTFQFRVHPQVIIRTIDSPLNEGGALVIRNIAPNSDLLRLDLTSIASGLDNMASKCPRHFADFLNGNADTITGSVFLQCCLFGDLIY